MSLLVALTVCIAASWPAQPVVGASSWGAPILVPRDVSVRSERTTAPLTGRASWYSAPGSVAAAGPRLRRALGPGWRGQWVRVSSGSRSVVVELADFCQCYQGTRGERLVDLSDDDFAVLAPLASGVVRVRITAILPPPTDTAP